MKKLFIFLIGLVIAGAVYSTTLTSDINSKGTDSWFLEYISASKLISMIRNNEDVTAANTIAYTECGTTFFLNSATEFASTLPTPEAGCSFRFVIKAAPVGANYTVVTSGSGNIINGLALVNGASVTCATEDTITFTASAAIAGDWVELVSDGTYWYMSGQGHAATAIACSAT